ncbi:MAG TPA: hypothetical protein VHY48_00920 [Acidobacteriaceae bacterium]|jgi:hypothetical protein|nr:hypothetical protein [Acidobacteriaceae bacterium]
MSLMDAPAYDASSDRRNRNIILTVGVIILVFIVLFFVGRIAGHGYLFTDLPAEHRVSNFFNALEARDYAKAYGIYNNDPHWQQHPQKYSDYPLARFTDDWTAHSPINAPITSHHVDVSSPDGSGFFGTGIIVAVRVNGNHKVFMYVNRADGTMTWPAPHILVY